MDYLDWPSLSMAIYLRITLLWLSIDRHFVTPLWSHRQWYLSNSYLDTKHDILISGWRGYGSLSMSHDGNVENKSCVTMHSHLCHIWVTVLLGLKIQIFIQLNNLFHMTIFKWTWFIDFCLQSSFVCETTISSEMHLMPRITVIAATIRHYEW